MIEVGIARVAITVVRQSRMNRRIVAETSTAASRRWNFTSSIDFRTNRDLSRVTTILMSGGRVALTSSSRALRSSTTLTVFMPDCFWIDRLTASSPSSRALVRGSSNESSALPTSLIRIGVPPLLVMIRSSNCWRGVEPAEGPEDQLASPLVDPAAGLLEVLPLERGPDVVDREASRRRACRRRRSR